MFRFNQIFLVVLFTGLSNFFFVSEANALVSWGGEKMIKVAEFPDSPEFQNPEGYYIDAGLKYKQISLFFIPIWNYELSPIGYINQSSYLSMTQSDLEELAQSAGVTLPDNPKPSFWERIGGKLVIVVGLVLFGMWKTDDDEEEVEQPTTIDPAKIGA